MVVDNLFLGKEENLASARERFPDLKLYREDVSDYDAMRAILAAEAVDVVFDLAVIRCPRRSSGRAGPSTSTWP